ncbi:hypothetical protein Lal_00015079 [Lupinus albus]|nr:hypothetical protein Lal_00015079 [Lupinus albus]
MGLRPRAAPADGVLRPRHHGPAREPRHQRHRGREDPVHPGAVRDPRFVHRPRRHVDRDGVAGLAPDGDRAGARARGAGHRVAVPAAVRARGHARAGAAQRHQRPDGGIHRRHERAAGEQCAAPLRPALRPHQRPALHGPRGRAARQRLPAAARARLPQRGPAGRRHLQLRPAQHERRRSGRAVCVHQLHRARRRAAHPDHDAVLGPAAGRRRDGARGRAARRGGRRGAPGRTRDAGTQARGRRRAGRARARPVVRLRGRPDRAARPVAGHPAGCLLRHRRPHRQRQVHAAVAAAALLPVRPGFDHAVRRTAGGHRQRTLPRGSRPRAAGPVPARGVGAREHRHGPRPFPGVHRGGRPRRPRARVHRTAGTRLRHAAGRRRLAPVVRPEAADRDRARPRRPTPHPAAGRSHVAHRQPDGENRAAGARRAARPGHDHRHRAPAVDDPRRRPHRRAEPRAHQRIRQPRRIDAHRRRPLPAAVSAAAAERLSRWSIPCSAAPTRPSAAGSAIARCRRRHGRGRHLAHAGARPLCRTRRNHPRDAPARGARAGWSGTPGAPHARRTCPPADPVLRPEPPPRQARRSRPAVRTGTATGPRGARRQPRGARAAVEGLCRVRPERHEPGAPARVGSGTPRRPQPRDRAAHPRADLVRRIVRRGRQLPRRAHQDAGRRDARAPDGRQAADRHRAQVAGLPVQPDARIRQGIRGDRRSGAAGRGDRFAGAPGHLQDDGIHPRRQLGRPRARHESAAVRARAGAPHRRRRDDLQHAREPGRLLPEAAGLAPRALVRPAGAGTGAEAARRRPRRHGPHERGPGLSRHGPPGRGQEAHRAGHGLVRTLRQQAGPAGRPRRIRRRAGARGRPRGRAGRVSPRARAVERTVRDAPPEGDDGTAGKIRGRQAPAPDRDAAQGKPGQVDGNRQPPPAAAHLVAAGARVRAGVRHRRHPVPQGAARQRPARSQEPGTQAAKRARPADGPVQPPPLPGIHAHAPGDRTAQHGERGHGRRHVPARRRPLQAHQRHVRPRRRRRRAARDRGRAARDPARDRHDRALGRRGIPRLPAGRPEGQPGRGGAPPADRHPGPRDRLPGHAAVGERVGRLRAVPARAGRRDLVGARHQHRRHGAVPGEGPRPQPRLRRARRGRPRSGVAGRGRARHRTGVARGGRGPGHRDGARAGIEDGVVTPLRATSPPAASFPRPVPLSSRPAPSLPAPLRAPRARPRRPSGPAPGPCPRPSR